MSKIEPKSSKRFVKTVAALSLAALTALSGWASGVGSVSAASKSHVVTRGESWWSIGNRYGVNYHTLASHNGASASQTIYVGQVLQIPGTKVTTPAPTPSERTHKVVAGESWWIIGNRYGVNYHTLASHNGFTASQTLYVGQVLKIPGTGTSGGSTAPAPTPTPAPAPEERTHKVAAGESWWIIGNRYGVNYHTLASHNGYSSTQMLYVGQVLKIPGSGSVSTPAPNPAPSKRGAERMVEAAAREVGSSNWKKYIGWYNNNPNHYWYDWCTVFVSYVANEAGYLNNTVIPKNSFTYMLRQDFVNKGAYYDKYATTPQPGDIAFFNVHGYSAGDTRVSHVAIVESVDGNTVYTIEGNRGGGTGSVVRMSHRITGDYLAGFGRPNYP